MKVWPILLAADTGLHMSWGGFEGWLRVVAVCVGCGSEVSRLSDMPILGNGATLEPGFVD